MPVFSLSIRTVAGTPPSRRNAAVWHPSQASIALLSDQTIASRRLCDSTILNATRSRAAPPTVMALKCAQSTWAWAPGGVSTRRGARIAGAG
jgi:hypothetical protein